MKKNKIITYFGTFLLLLASVSCSKFEEINRNPLAAGADQVKAEYFMNASIVGTQQDPNIAERAFVLYWKSAAHQQGDEYGTDGITSNMNQDDWSSQYYTYVAGWLNGITNAIKIGSDQVAAGKADAYTANVVQMARIWRAYLMSEATDLYGPLPIIGGFQGVNPDFSSVKDIYYFALDELKDATSKIDVTVTAKPSDPGLDKAYGFKYDKWIKYGNSLRMRLAMRLSEIDPAKAKAEFEDAASKPLLIAADDIFQVVENNGWDDLTGVMTRQWDMQSLSETQFNLYFGLGGVSTSTQVTGDALAYVKPANWMGVKYNKHFPSHVNDPSKGFHFDGLPYALDPRALKCFFIPGDYSNSNWCNYPSWSGAPKNYKGILKPIPGGNTSDIEVDRRFTWNGTTSGAWGDLDAYNNGRFYSYPGTCPGLAMQFRNGTSKRVFFGAWETFFLLAEANLKGWNTNGVSARLGYEDGVQASFDYFNLGSAATYLASTDYNRCGTSASWLHTTEPPASITMQCKNGYTNADESVTFTYPSNTIYKNGSVKNDLLTKIITQKYIAQMPWLPLESWSDYRRLGLPFFENVAVESTIVTLPNLTQSNYMTVDVKNFPQRIKYPSGLSNSSPAGYAKALGLLGADEIATPLWWAKH